MFSEGFAFSAANIIPSMAFGCFLLSGERLPSTFTSRLGFDRIGGFILHSACARYDSFRLCRRIERK